GLFPTRKAAGGHRPHHWRLHHAEKGRRTEFPRAVPVPWGKNPILLRPCGSPVLSLLRLRGRWRCFFLCAEDRERGISRSGESGCAKIRNSIAQAGGAFSG